MNEKLLSVNQARTLLVQLSKYLTTQNINQLYKYDYDKWIRDRDEFIENSINDIVPPIEVREAQKYIIACHSDMGFMGSPIYYENRRIVDEYNKKLDQTN